MSYFLGHCHILLGWNQLNITSSTKASMHSIIEKEFSLLHINYNIVLSLKYNNKFRCYSFFECQH